MQYRSKVYLIAHKTGIKKQIHCDLIAGSVYLHAVFMKIRKNPILLYTIALIYKYECHLGQMLL